MEVGVLLATLPVSFFDHRTGLSALAVQHVHADGRSALVYHDAPNVSAARPLLGGVAETLVNALPPGHTLSLVESSVPEHHAEPFVYARVTLTYAASSGHVSADSQRVVGADAVARACGIDIRELERTETLVRAIHRPRACAFPGFRQLALGDRTRRVLAVA
jgi:hypothetical protein